MKIDFTNRTVIITGAGNGLGRTYALFLASRGAQVVVNDLGGSRNGIGQSNAPAQIVIDEIKAAGGEASANYDDVSKPEGAENLIKQTLEAYGAIDALICNAGILRDKSFTKMSLEDFEAVLRVHLFGTVYPLKFAFLIMRERGYGRVVVTTSVSGLYGNFGQTNYAAAKLAVIGLMNALKLEGEKYNILINTIAPIAVTRLGGDAFPDQAAPVLRPESVVPAVAYLASEACQTSGDIITAGAGYFSRARIVEGAGVRFDAKQEITPEMFAESFNKISDLSKAAGFNNATEAFTAVLRDFI